MSDELKKIEALAKLHIPNPEAMSSRLKAVLDYVGQLKDFKLDVPALEVDQAIDVTDDVHTQTHASFADIDAIKKNCPTLEDNQVVVPQFVDRKA